MTRVYCIYVLFGTYEYKWVSSVYCVLNCKFCNNLYASSSISKQMVRQFSQQRLHPSSPPSSLSGLSARGYFSQRHIYLFLPPAFSPPPRHREGLCQLLREQIIHKHHWSCSVISTAAAKLEPKHNSITFESTNAQRLTGCDWHTHHFAWTSKGLCDLYFKYPPHSQPTLAGVNGVIVSVCSGTHVAMVACCCTLCYISAQTAQVENLISFLK